MRYLDTRVLSKLDRGGRSARPRRYVWLVWMQPHLRDGTWRTAQRTVIRWPVYLLNGGAR